MGMIGQIIFLILVVVTFGIAFRKYSKLRRNILLGKDTEIKGDKGERMKNTLLIAFGQKKMFKRIIPAVMHLFIYVAFLFTQIELIEIFVDGLSGKHRFFRPFLGGVYTGLISFIELLSLGAFVATLVFLARRNLLKVPRFQMDEMTGWPKLDGNLILYAEILLLIGIFSMNGADEVLYNAGHTHAVGASGQGSFGFAISQWLGPALFGGMSVGALEFIERAGWWLHIIVVLGFINYLPYSKHLHIFLAFPNVYFSKLNSRGEMDNMPDIMNEVKSMMGLIPESEAAPAGDPNDMPKFGASDVSDLTWKNMLDAYTCTECGRCTSVCPANITGKKLSPRKIMMDVRDRAEEIGKHLDINNLEVISVDKKDGATQLTKDNFDDGKSLFDYISNEEIHACTTCNACVEACPVMINPLDIILQLRRHEILDLAAGPGDWTPMFTSIENSGSVWQIPDARDKWAQEID